MYQWIVFAHVLGVFGFLLAHGTAAAVSFKLRGEREVTRVHALLDLSRAVTAISSVSLLVLLIAGITAAFMGDWWGQRWIWTSLVLFVAIGISMTAVGSRPLNRIRALLQPGAPSRAKKTAVQASTDATLDQQLAVMLSQVHPWLLTALGGGGLAVILWLMMFKPF